VTRLSTETGLHENTVRSHLEGLERANAVVRTLAPTRTRGRPAWLYVAAQHRDPSEATAFVSALVGALRQESAAPKRVAVSAGRVWGAAVGLERRPADPTVVARRTWVLETLAALGFEPQDSNPQDSDTLSIRITRCPLLEAARADPDMVCSVHLGMVRGALHAAGLPETGVRLRPFHEPGACRLELDEVAAPRVAP
jgi:predicted ArsR family transcriptional regulator